MSLGNFNEITEKSRNKIFEMPENYDEDFDRKLDANESSQVSKNEKQDGSRESRGDGMSLLDKMKTLLFKKEREGGSEEKVEEQTEQYKDGSDKR
ncbi:MAG: hypothetical protein E7B18_10535 [Clostridium sp.]|nr:hypothetical protein [Clostridium sp.]